MIRPPGFHWQDNECRRRQQGRSASLRLPRRSPGALIHLILALGLILLPVGCQPAEVLSNSVAARETSTRILQPDHCLWDGATQTWQLLPLDPPESELLSAYQAGQIIEFRATLLGADENPANLPHRQYILDEVAEGITLTLEYLGDPPPMQVGQTYRVVAWASTAPEDEGYELQVFDSQGLLFLGVTDAELQDDPLGISLEDAEGDCPVVAVQGNECIAARQVHPLTLRWGENNLTMYPGDDVQMVQVGNLYEVSLFRNRTVTVVDPPCSDYHESHRSLRIERLEPPPAPPIFSEEITSTVPITARLLLTATQPITTP